MEGLEKLFPIVELMRSYYNPEHCLTHKEEHVQSQNITKDPSRHFKPCYPWSLEL